MFENVSNRFLLNLLLHKFYHPQRGPITKIAHRFLTFDQKKYHRVYATGPNPKAYGLGVHTDLYIAQLAAIMEYLERDYFFDQKIQGTTSGLCTRFSEKEAKKRSLFELVERDQALLSIYYKEELQEILSHDFGEKVRFFYMTFDLPIHVVMSVIATDTGGTTYGFGCSLSLTTATDVAIEKAFKEALLSSDSRNADLKQVEVPLKGKFNHIVPFLWPHLYPTILPKFNLDDYKISPFSKEFLRDHSYSDLLKAIKEKDIKIDYSLNQKPIGFFKKVVYCLGRSEDLQPLFFSGDTISINKKRVSKLGLPEKPKHAILHPIA